MGAAANEMDCSPYVIDILMKFSVTNHTPREVAGDLFDGLAFVPTLSSYNWDGLHNFLKRLI